MRLKATLFRMTLFAAVCVTVVAARTHIERIIETEMYPWKDTKIQKTSLLLVVA